MRRYHITVVCAMLLCGMSTVFAQSALLNQAAQNGAFLNLHKFEDPQPAPGVLFYDEHGEPTYLGNFRGKVVVLNLWATWCGPCVMEMPSLDKLQRRYKRAGLEVVPVAMEESPEKVKSFMREHRLRYLPIYFDPEQMVGPAFTSKALPTTFLINRKGEIVARMDAADDWYSPELRAEIEELLKVEVPENPSLPQLNIQDVKPQKSGGVHLN